MNPDSLIVEFDKALRTVFGAVRAVRPNPALGIDEAELGERERRHAVALMRVNHCGEVCAQALYQGQALAAGNAGIKSDLGRAAREEADHLAWCERRIAELGGRTSVLNPLWYAGALAMGYAAGRLGEGWNLGFLAETESQVEQHLQGHLDRLDARDARTRAVVETMQHEEAGHAQMARSLGARELPDPVKRAMRGAARLMTTASYLV